MRLEHRGAEPACGGRGHAEQEEEDIHREEGDQELRKRDERERQTAHSVVRDRIPPSGGDDSEHDAERHADDQRNKAKFERSREPGGEIGCDGLPGVPSVSQVASRESGQVVRVLADEWLVESELLPEGLESFLGPYRSYQRLDRIDRENALHHEGDRRHGDDQHERRDHAPEYVPSHLAGCSSGSGPRPVQGHTYRVRSQKMAVPSCTG